MGSIGQKSTFLEHCHAAYQIKENHEMQQHGNKYFARRPPTPPLRMGSVGQIKENRVCRPHYSTTYPDPGDGINRSKFVFFMFLEHCHVAYQIKVNHEMQQHGSKY